MGPGVISPPEHPPPFEVAPRLPSTPTARSHRAVTSLSLQLWGDVLVDDEQSPQPGAQVCSVSLAASAPSCPQGLPQADQRPAETSLLSAPAGDA